MRSISLAATLLISASPSALLAQTQPSPTAAPTVSDPATSTDAQAEAEVVVVGTSVRASLAKIERQPTPIQVLSSTAIGLAGQRSVGDLLRTQPAFSGTSRSADGVGLGRQSLNLRGIGEQYTLALVNGRRFAVNGAANVGIIPFVAIDRIEVLTAGASSIYGSDAVAGVVNVVLDTKLDGVRAEARYSNGFAGLSERQYGAAVGVQGENGGFTLAGEYFDRHGLRNASLPQGSNDLRSFGFLDFRSSFTQPARITLANGSDVILDTSRFGAGRSSSNPADYRAYDGNRDAYDRQRGGIYAISPTTRASLYFNGHRDLGEATTLTLDVLANRTKDRYLTGSSVSAINVPATNPYNPFGTAVTANYRFLDASGPFGEGTGSQYTLTLDTLSSALKLEHNFSSSLSFALTGNYFREESRLFVPNAYSQLGLTSAVNRTGPDAFNPFCNRCNTAAQFAGVVVGARTNTTSQLKEVDARFTGSLFALPGGDLQFAAGAAYRHEDFSVDPDEALAQGALVDMGVTPRQKLGRGITSVFAELRAPLLARVEVQAAARYEHYSDFGGTFNPLIAVKWEAVPANVTLRGSYTTAFRAPYLQDLTSEQVLTQLPVADPTTKQVVQAVAISGGNPNLGSESSRTFSAGVILTPQFARGLSLSFDFYDLKQDDLVITPTPQAVLSGLAPGTVLRGPNVGAPGRDILITALKVNGGSRKVRGLDFLFRYQRDFASSSGNLAFDLSGTRLFDYKLDLRDGSGYVQQAGTYSATFGGIPRWKLSLGPTVRYGPVLANARLRHIGGYSDPPLFGFAERRVGSQNYIDLSARLDLGRDGLGIVPGAELTAGVTNLADKRPPFVRSAALFFSDGSAFDRGNHDIGGRVVYGSVGIKF